MSTRDRDRAVLVRVSESDWQLLAFEAVRRNRRGRGRVLLDLAEPALTELRKNGGEQ